MADQNQPPPINQAPAPTTTGTIELKKRVFNGEDFFAFKNFAFALGTCDNKPNGTPCELGGICIEGQCHWNTMALAAKGIAVGS